jgi:signal transduction histidine kinase
MKLKSLQNAVSQELNKALWIIDRFIHSCSHNLESPLASIEGLVLIAGYCTNPMEVTKCLRLIKRSSFDMQNTIHHLEEYTGNLQLGLVQEEIEVDRLVEKIVDDLAQEILRHKVEISTTISQPYRWFSDANCQYLILKSLVSNAISYCDTTKEVKKISIKVSVNAEWVNMEVTDNGIGIFSDEKGKIFEPHNGSTPSKGNCLGLYLVKGLVDKLEASISVSSEENIGTSFRLSFPNNQCHEKN